MDDTEKEILLLIHEETEKKDKAFLLLVYRMFQELRANTNSTKKIEEELIKQVTSLDKHLAEEEVAMGVFRGGWKVTLIAMSIGGILIGVIQFLGLRVIDNHISLDQEDTIKIQEHDKRIAELEKWKAAEDAQLGEINRNIDDIKKYFFSIPPTGLVFKK